MTQYNESPRITPPGVVIPLEWLDMFTKMPGALAGEAIVAILIYGATGALPDFTDPALEILWPIFQARLDSNRERYCKKVERSRAAQERKAAAAAETRKTTRAPSITALNDREAYEKSLEKWL